MLVPILLPLLLLEAIIPATATLVSTRSVSYRNSRTTQNGPVRCALDTANETSSSSSLEECSLNCARNDTCTGFNIKNSFLLTCDHVMTPVLASTSRTHSPVITWWHLYWLQHQELTHLWSRDDISTGFNIKNSTTCDVYNYDPKITAPVSGCTFYEVDNFSNLFTIFIVRHVHFYRQLKDLRGREYFWKLTHLFSMCLDSAKMRITMV